MNGDYWRPGEAIPEEELISMFTGLTPEVMQLAHNRAERKRKSRDNAIAAALVMGMWVGLLILAFTRI